MKTIAEYNGLKVPSYALPYLVNGDDSGITPEDKHNIDLWYKDYEGRLQEGESLIFAVEDNEQEQYFTWNPEFGLPCDVVDCTILILGND